MKLFLSSQAISQAQAPHLVKLVGKPAEDIKLALIENAADVEDGPKDWLTRNRANIMSHGFDVERLDLQDYMGDADDLWDRLASKDVIWCGGGNTFYLNWLLHETGADVIIQGLVKDGIVYGGGSAGAIVAGPTLKHFEIADDPSKAPELLLDGLAVTQTVVVPHADNEKYGPLMHDITEKLQSDGYATVLLKDAQALVVNGREWKVVE